VASNVGKLQFVDGLATLTVDFDPNAVKDVGGSRDKAAMQKFYGDIIARCHQVGVQVLVGMHHAGNPPPSDRALEFREFMKEVVKQPDRMQEAIDGFLGQLDDFLFGADGATPDADGLSFDIEHGPPDVDVANNIVPPNAMPVADQVKFFTSFYQSAALLMQQRDKLLVVAVGQFGAGASSKPRSLAELDKAFNVGGSFAFTRSHPYTIALKDGQPIRNLILRPMAFGKLAHATTPEKLKVWFREIVDYALNFIGLDPAQFQIILELGENPGQLRSGSSDLAEICRTTLRPNRVGLAPFAHGGESWDIYKTIDGRLNAGERPPGTPGQPIQVPRRE
jgi:hypothetical protein